MVKKERSEVKGMFTTFAKTPDSPGWRIGISKTDDCGLPFNRNRGFSGMGDKNG